MAICQDIATQPQLMPTCQDVVTQVKAMVISQDVEETCSRFKAPTIRQHVKETSAQKKRVNEAKVAPKMVREFLR